MRSSNSARVHFSTTNLNSGPAACGENRDPRRRLTLDPFAVTCRRCMLTNAWDEASDTVMALDARSTEDRE